MRRHRGDVGCGFLFGAPEADAPTLFCKTPTSPIEKLIPNNWILALTARTWAFQNCMSLIRRTKHVPESGFRSPGNFFILNKLAERVGFSRDHLAQTAVNTTLGDNNQCLCGLQAHS